MRAALQQRSNRAERKRGWGTTGCGSIGQTDVLIPVAVLAIVIVVPRLLVAKGTLTITDTGGGGVSDDAEKAHDGQDGLDELNGPALGQTRNDLEQVKHAVDEGDAQGSERGEEDLILEANLPVDLGSLVGGVGDGGIDGVIHSDFLHSFDRKI